MPTPVSATDSSTAPSTRRRDSVEAERFRYLSDSRASENTRSYSPATPQVVFFQQLADLHVTLLMEVIHLFLG